MNEPLNPPDLPNPTSQEDAPRWTPLCASSDVAENRARAATLDGKQLVVWRDGEGGIHVWDDRCPHRGETLSDGVVAGGLIACASHGWRFDVNGQQIRLINSTQSARCDAKIHATVHDAHERNGYVWVRVPLARAAVVKDARASAASHHECA
ncbi:MULTISPECIES: Rieske 2Fe-2S domain-containing protein [Paraburkholderia]|uniref:Rieske-like 2Fe-2S protein n=1 Tax=Paraburkholderia tropica TaxID=92647 RepID=A0ABX5MRS5_9BURK|nr:MULTISPECIES: Rieske 2Fe-2S domain-containing protein [Paraburkholderia]MBB2980659.1 phenylpropionate dioxygenase-like ring-hydroxylating dioxygenase large terminal subunit [Paraburkholderia tropica]MBB3003329.1 phenylpropionate dioxygenase-like ring-hydroxylating dioxygenase large terminal subunit [Paraburkholderia tropica]MBB6322345.1 phenylpropionate dioxygenase-like ring-hydroxylating dioxygenase large terminal subunit [Paraburkholderia tropica]MDE1140030.1 Rieske 2Fe-2S domain-containin